MTTRQIPPHGGKLIDRRTRDSEREALLEKAKSLKHIRLDSREISDVEMLATGALSPLEGFMNRGDYENVLDVKRLANGLPWTIPITFAVAQEEARALREGDEVALIDDKKLVLAILHLEEKFELDKEKEAQQVYGTLDRKHPGVDKLFGQGDILLGGKVSVLNLPLHTNFREYRLEPKETRRLFKEKGWRRIVAFQTRNPVHRAHEYIQKCALEVVDGLLLHPIVGETKGDDIPADVRMRCYEVLLEKYYPKDRVLLAVNPAAMRYAGPREAIFHAIIRKNYGCTHFIVGRDHAGVGGFYGPFDAHYIFDEFEPDELEITPLFFDNTFYCKRCGGMASYKTCAHQSTEHISLSGTKLREMLAGKKAPPQEITRPEVAQVLIEWLSRASYEI